MDARRSARDDGVSRLEEFMTRHERQVLAYAMRRTPTAADAEEVAAETFIVAWRKIGHVPDDALPWLLAVARRVLANQRRGQRRRWALFNRLTERASTQPVETTSATGPALAALARLRPDDQELLKLVAWEELDHRSIGLVLGISPNAVAIRLHRARQRFADALKEFDSSRTSPVMKGTINGAIKERVE